MINRCEFIFAVNTFPLLRFEVRQVVETQSKTPTIARVVCGIEHIEVENYFRRV